jgi:hypothetical protein
MQKITQIVTLVAALATSVSAYAIYKPGWQRPIYKAQLVEKDTLGHELGIGFTKELTLHKMDQATRPTLLTFTEELKVYCFVAPCPRPKVTTKFVIVAKRPAGCGSVKYIAYAQKDRTAPETPPLKLVLVDHATRVCRDYRPYRWEAKLQREGAPARLLFGNPEGVITIQ